MLKRLFIYFSVVVGFSNIIHGQSRGGNYTEIGVMAGPAFFKSDFGERGNFENFYKNNGFSIGGVYYLSGIANYSEFSRSFKIRLELSFAKYELAHYGAYVDNSSNSLFTRQLRAMKGDLNLANFGAQLEYFPFYTDDYTRQRIAPYVSLGGQISYYDAKISSDLGRIGTPATTPQKYLDNGFKNEQSQVASVTASVGTRYKLRNGDALFVDLKAQYYFSDWVDGLNPNRRIYTENKYNDWSTVLNFGYIYYFD